MAAVTAATCAGPPTRATVFSAYQSWRSSIPSFFSVSATIPRAALQNSDNYAAMRTGLTAGMDPFAKLVAQAARTEIPSYPSSFLGACELTPVQLTAAFTTFP